MDLDLALHTFTIKRPFFSMYFTIGLPIDLEIRLGVKAFEVNAGERWKSKGCSIEAWM